jgi:hypothetical protein
LAEGYADLGGMGILGSGVDRGLLRLLGAWIERTPLTFFVLAGAVVQ